MTDALVIGAGPAGLMAADVLSEAGHDVLVVDAMPSVGRKFLMAGKSGLNLTKEEPAQDFIAAYGDIPHAMQTALAAFGPDDVKAFAAGLGQPIFTGSTGRVFPNAMKASPLLRAWLARMTSAGVRFQTKWRWTGWADQAATFLTPDGPQSVQANVTVLALGGASWSRLGSDGKWVQHLGQTVPFQPANMGFNVDWSDHMTRHFGKPVKGVALHVAGQTSRGEFVVSSRGIEGGGIYAVSRPMREGHQLFLDLLPDWTEAKIRAALERPRGKASLTNFLRKTLRLDPVRLALLLEWARPFPADLAPAIKALPVIHKGPRPIDEAISTAGGLGFEALDENLMLKDRPGVFCVGEMLDWEAPTGGYLITGCLATGRHAGLAARARLAASPSV